jgi:hypothetical protein
MRNAKVEGRYKVARVHNREGYRTNRGRAPCILNLGAVGVVSG